MSDKTLQFGVNLNNREPLIAPDYDVDDVASKVVNAILGYTDYVNRTVWRK